jgi:hypothetical protein
MADGAMNIVIVRSGFTHSLETPIGGGCSRQIEKLIVEFTEGAVR